MGEVSAIENPLYTCRGLRANLTVRVDFGHTTCTRLIRVEGEYPALHRVDTTSHRLRDGGPHWSETVSAVGETLVST